MKFFPKCLALCIGWIILDISGNGACAQERRELLPQPAPGSLPPLKPPPGVEVTDEDFNNLLLKPFEDDPTLPIWERKKHEPEPIKPKAIRPEIIEEPEETGTATIPDIIAVPDVIDVPEGPILVLENNPFEARKRAVNEGRFMLMVFTGNEWNASSQKLSWEVFNSTEFLEYAEDSLVACFLDYPLKMPKADSPLGRFKNHYGIHGLPAVVLFDSEGTPFIKKSGYAPGNAETYIAELRVLIERRQQQLADRREKLIGEGFREWHNREGRSFFGKVTRVDEGEVWFSDPNGKDAKVSISKLSLEDQAHLGAVAERVPE